MSEYSSKLQSRELISQSVFRMKESRERIHQCFSELSEDEVWQKPNVSSNSMGNLILHLCGNITQYILSSLGEAPDHRERDLEFSTTGGFGKTELLNRLDEVLKNAFEIIQIKDTDQLLKVHQVQGFELSGIGIILHVVEHLSYHTGQIAFWVKLLKDKDLGFYAGVDLNQKNG